MKPGRELDALVAEKVMGWSIADDGAVIIDGAHLPCPSFSEDIAAAWLVVEKIPGNITLHRDGKRWFLLGEEISADTAPHAICLAALKAVGALSDTP